MHYNTADIRDFKRQGTEGIIQCKIRSITFPLLEDHVVREANHYIRMLKSFNKTRLIESKEAFKLNFNNIKIKT
jgi:hypothetical protein